MKNKFESCPGKSLSKSLTLTFSLFLMGFFFLASPALAGSEKNREERHPAIGLKALDLLISTPAQPEAFSLLTWR